MVRLIPAHVRGGVDTSSSEHPQPLNLSSRMMIHQRKTSVSSSSEHPQPLNLEALRARGVVTSEFQAQASILSHLTSMDTLKMLWVVGQFQAQASILSHLTNLHLCLIVEKIYLCVSSSSEHPQPLNLSGYEDGTNNN